MADTLQHRTSCCCYISKRLFCPFESLLVIRNRYRDEILSPRRWDYNWGPLEFCFRRHFVPVYVCVCILVGLEIPGTLSLQIALLPCLSNIASSLHHRTCILPLWKIILYVFLHCAKEAEMAWWWISLLPIPVAGSTFSMREQISWCDKSVALWNCLRHFPKQCCWFPALHPLHKVFNVDSKACFRDGNLVACSRYRSLYRTPFLN